MTAVTIYRAATGQILRTVESDDPEFLALNMAGDEAAFWGELDPETHYVSGFDAIPFPTAPGDWAVWDWEAHIWSDPRDAAWYAVRLIEAKAMGLARITALRGRARLVYITDIPGQEGLYIAKLEEARGYLAETDPDMADYPLIASEVGITATTAYEVAQIFINLNALWKQAAGQIDGACFAAELAVQAAEDVAGVEAVVSALAILLSGAAS